MKQAVEHPEELDPPVFTSQGNIATFGVYKPDDCENEEECSLVNVGNLQPPEASSDDAKDEG